ncbi:MAG TPA: hypothetical protein PKJ78_02930 [Candidatus Hydrogenedentes bacterium]|nr:hypothetical protein [Candidatus Hydrogenedentota bacterium]
MSRTYLKMFQSRAFRRVLNAAAVLAIGVLVAASSSACDVPVYEWAVLNWPPDSYELLVFHEQPLERTIAGALGEFHAEGGPENRALNLEVREVEVGSAMGDTDAQIWRRENPGYSPWMALRYPNMPADFPSLWVGKATAEEIGCISNSPARRSIAGALMRGVSHIWVLLGCGDEVKDADARTQLETGIARIADMLDRDAISPNAHITHEIVEVSRRDPAEWVLVQTLLRSEPDLMGYDAPMVFPVFGRGRALYALVGAGITAENLRDACAYIAGRCSCLVKDENPGVDLLLAADWAGLVSARAAAQPVPQTAGPGHDMADDTLPPAARPGRYILAGLAGAAVMVIALSALLLGKTRS